MSRPHVTGTAGEISLESVRVLDDAAGERRRSSADRHPSTSQHARPAPSASDSPSPTAPTPATGTARITILPADAPAQLATAPVVAFVHPQEDATLDVFSAVSNPTRRVLLLSDVVGDADPGATLSVDGVGQNYLRVSGTTPTGRRAAGHRHLHDQRRHR